MKKTLLFFLALAATTLAFAAKIYVNPGHGGWDANCRGMGTIPYPLKSTGLPDTLGFYESNTNLWKCLYLTEKLRAAGHTVVMSHTKCGVSPELSVIATEAQRSGADYFISVHSNAIAEGSTTNYPAYFYRGTTGNDYASGSINRIKKAWPYCFDIHNQGMEPNSNYSLTNVGLYADITFQKGSYDVTTIDGVTYTGYYGVLRHGIPGYLIEGYFHTYQPARHRALNPEWCRQEGLRHYRGIAAWYGNAPETKGYIMGYIRTKEKEINQTYYTGRAGNDIYMPINGARVYLTNAAGDTVRTDCYNYVARKLTNQKCYTTDNNYNGVFAYEDLTPGTYTITVRANGYKKYTQTINVTADQTAYTQIFLTSGTDNEEEPEPTPTPGSGTTIDPGYDGTEVESASGMNPYAYALSSSLNADSTEITIHFSLNAEATSVKVIFNDGEKDYVMRSYGKTAANHYQSAIPTAELPRNKQLTWRVDVTGAGFKNATKISKEYYFYHPASVDVDDNPQSPNFGRLLCTEGYQEITTKTGTTNGSSGSPYNTYKSYTLGAGLYEFDAKFDYVGGYNGGNTFKVYREDLTAQKSIAPYRIRIADDGRVFVTSFNGGTNWGGKILWLVDQNNLNSWTPAFGYSYINTTSSNLVTADGYYIAAPNIGFDVLGSGSNLKLLMLSGTQACYNYDVKAFRCYEYAWGNKTSWATAPTRKIFDGNSANNCNSTYQVVNYSSAQVQYDKQGGIWVCQYQDKSTETYPSLVYYDKDGTYRYHEVMNNRGGGGFRFNKDYTRVIISGGNGVNGEATVYTVSNDANGYPTKLTKEFTIALNIGTNITDFAWDYADNIYAISYSKEKLVAYALPHSNGRVVSTPAASKYAFMLEGEVIPTYHVTYHNLLADGNDLDTNRELWELYMPLYNDYVYGKFATGTRYAQGLGMGVNADGTKVDSILTFFNTTTSMNDHMRSFMEEGTSMAWLAEYIQTVASPTTSYQWCIEMAGFFRCGQKVMSSYSSADYTEAGKPENWLPYYWKHMCGLDNELTDTTTLPTSIKPCITLVNPIQNNRPTLPTWYVANAATDKMLAWRKASATGNVVLQVTEDMALYATWMDKYIAEELDNTDVINLLQLNKAPHNITVDYPLSAEQFQPICLPFEVTTLDDTPYQGAIVLTLVGAQIKTVGQQQQVELQFEQRTAEPAMMAGVPYLIKPQTDINEAVTFSNVQNIDAMATVKYEIDDQHQVLFQPLVAPTNILAGNYTWGANDVLQKLAIDTQINALHAYFQLLGFDETVTPVISAGEHIGTSLQNIGTTPEIKKIIHRGQLYIIRQGVTYTITGAKVK